MTTGQTTKPCKTFNRPRTQGINNPKPAKQKMGNKHPPTHTQHQNHHHHNKNKIAGINKYYSLIHLNISGLFSPMKKHRLTEWMRKEDPSFSCIQDMLLNPKDRDYLRVKDEKIS